MGLLRVLYHAFYNTNVSAYHNTVVDLILILHQKHFLLYNVEYLDTRLKTIVLHHHQKQQNQNVKHGRHDRLNQENYILPENLDLPTIKSNIFLFLREKISYKIYSPFFN